MLHSSAWPTVLDDTELDKEIIKRIVDSFNGRGERDNNSSYTVNAGMLMSSNTEVDSEMTRYGFWTCSEF